MAAIEKKVSGFRIVNAVLLILAAVMCIIPFYYVIMVSLSDPLRVSEGKLIPYPQGFSLEAYYMIFRQRIFFTSLKNSVVRTVFGGAINLILQCLTAYPLSQRRLRGRKRWMLMVIFTMLFNGGIIPTYLVVKLTGIVDTMWAMILPNAISAWNVTILVNFFANIPDSISESARIDGANDFVIFARLVVPLSIPSIAVIALYIAVGHWNALMDAVLYVNKTSLKPLQVYLMDLVMRNQMTDMVPDSSSNITTLSLQTSAIFASTLPILFVYPFVQKYFVQGVMIGAVKG